MAKLGFNLTMSLDGYAAGPRPELENPLGRGDRVARLGDRDPRLSCHPGMEEARAGSMMLTWRPGTRTSAPPSWDATCSVPDTVGLGQDDTWTGLVG